MSVNDFKMLLDAGSNLKLTVSERLLLGAYLFRAYDDGTCNYGYSRIGQQIGKDKANVKKLCDSLQEKGLIRPQEDGGVIVVTEELKKYLTKTTAPAPAKGGTDDPPKAEKTTTPPQEVSYTPEGSNMHPPQGGSLHPPYKQLNLVRESRDAPNPPKGGHSQARVPLDSSDDDFLRAILRPMALVATSAYLQVQLLRKGRQCRHCGYSIDQIYNELSAVLSDPNNQSTVTEDARRALNVMSQMTDRYGETHPIPPQVIYDFEPFLAKYPRKPSNLEFFLEEWCRLTDAGISPDRLIEALDDAMHQNPNGLILHENKISRPEEWLYAKAEEWLP